MLNGKQMRSLLLYFFLVISLGCFSQTKDVIKVSKAQVECVKSIKELIPDLKNCEVNSFKFSFGTHGKVIEWGSKNEFFTKSMIESMQSFQKGQKFFIEKINSNCTSIKNSYKLIKD